MALGLAARQVMPLLCETGQLACTQHVVAVLLLLSRERRNLPSGQRVRKSNSRYADDDDDEDVFAAPRAKKPKVELICVCQKPYNPEDFCVGCDDCDGWFHPACVGITEQEAEVIGVFTACCCGTPLALLFFQGLA